MDGADVLLQERDEVVIRISSRFTFAHDMQHAAFALSAFADGHRNPYCGAIGRVDPRVVRHGVYERHWGRATQVRLDCAANIGLAKTVRRDEAEASNLASANQTCRVVPPAHDEVSRFGYIGPSSLQRIDVSVA